MRGRPLTLLFWQHSIGAGIPEVWVVPVQSQSNVLSWYTNMRVIIPHAGAYIPYQAVRVSTSGNGGLSDGQERMAQLKRLYFDTAMSGVYSPPPQATCLSNQVHLCAHAPADMKIPCAFSCSSRTENVHAIWLHMLKPLLVRLSLITLMLCRQHVHSPQSHGIHGRAKSHIWLRLPIRSKRVSRSHSERPQ